MSAMATAAITASTSAAGEFPAVSDGSVDEPTGAAPGPKALRRI
jgi:hypothetical protein